MNACIKDWEGAEKVEGMTDEQLRERERLAHLKRKHEEPPEPTLTEADIYCQPDRYFR